VGGDGRSRACPYTLDLDNDANNRFVSGMLKNYNAIPGFYAAGLYVNCQVADAGLKVANGDPGDRVKFMVTLKAVNLINPPRGPIKFDHLNNVIGNIYIRHLGTEGVKYGPETLEQDDQDLRERQPILDLARAGVPLVSSLFTRLSAGDQVQHDLKDL
jgi:ABC-type branched-subunit amino acid transport system substrate-binding protein